MVFASTICDVRFYGFDFACACHFFVDVDCEHVEMLRNTLSRLESNRGHLQLNLYLRLAANQGRWGTAIFEKCLCIPSLEIQACEFSCRSLFDVS